MTILGLLSTYLLISAASLVLFVVVIVALPATYFSSQRHLWIDRHPIIRWFGFLGKNLLGLAIVGLGILLSLPGIPGQGLLTILVGAVLVDFPGKQAFVLGLIRRQGVLLNVNRLRQVFRRPPLVI
jgi:hypothetical protein